MKNRSLLAILLVAFCLMLLPGTSEAGKPIYKDEGEQTDFARAKVIPDVDGLGTAYSYYASLGAGKVDIYQIYAKAGQLPNLSLAVPKSDDLKSFTPSLALVGPGITSTTQVTLPVMPPAGTDAVVLDFSGDVNARSSGSDSASGQAIWLGQTYNTPFTQDGPYFLVVWDKGGRAGKYILNLGDREETGLFDIIKFPYTWLKLQLWFGNWMTVIIALVVVILIVGAIVALMRRRRPTAPAAS